MKVLHATESWEGQPTQDAGIPKSWPFAKYIDLQAGDARRWWPRSVWELLDFNGKRQQLVLRLRSSIEKAVKTSPALIALDLECGAAFASPSYYVASQLHGSVDPSVWANFCYTIGAQNQVRAYESLFADFISEAAGPQAVALDDFPHRHDSPYAMDFGYVDNDWFSAARPVIVTCYLQHPGQDPAAVRISHDYTIKLGLRCAARRAQQLFVTVSPQYEQAGEYVTRDEWSAAVNRIAANNASMIFWGRWKDEAAAAACKHFLEVRGGLLAIEQAGGLA